MTCPCSDCTELKKRLVEAFETGVIYDAGRIVADKVNKVLDADDIVQEGVSYLLQKHRPFKYSTPSSFRAFLIITLHRVALNHMRKNSVKMFNDPVRGDAVLRAVDKEDYPHLQTEKALDVELTLTRVSPRSRSLLESYYLEEEKLYKIAEKLGKNVNTVTGWIRVARSEFLDHFENV